MARPTRDELIRLMSLSNFARRSASALTRPLISARTSAISALDVELILVLPGARPNDDPLRVRFRLDEVEDGRFTAAPRRMDANGEGVEVRMAKSREDWRHHDVETEQVFDGRIVVPQADDDGLASKGVRLGHRTALASRSLPTRLASLAQRIAYAASVAEESRSRGGERRRGTLSLHPSPATESRLEVGQRGVAIVEPVTHADSVGRMKTVRKKWLAAKPI